MTKAAIVISWISLFIVFAVDLWIWLRLPDLPRYPVHWNVHGIADGFGSKGQVFFNLLIIPVNMVFMFALAVFVPKIEPKKQIFWRVAAPLPWCGLP